MGRAEERCHEFAELVQEPAIAGRCLQALGDRGKAHASVTEGAWVFQGAGMIEVTTPRPYTRGRECPLNRTPVNDWRSLAGRK